VLEHAAVGAAQDVLEVGAAIGSHARNVHVETGLPAAIAGAATELDEQLGLDDEGVPFHVKKEATSALRRLAPIGLSTDIIWTANVRTLRHVIEMRTDPGAEEELRLVFDTIAEIAQREAPFLFQDFSRQDDGSWVPVYRKV
jgi:thymidylate synthase (FAD)